MIELMKFDDQIYIEEGFRREQIDKAVTHYGFDKQPAGGAGGLGGLGGMLGLGGAGASRAEPEDEEEESGLRPAGKQIILS